MKKSQRFLPALLTVSLALGMTPAAALAIDGEAPEGTDPNSAISPIEGDGEQLPEVPQDPTMQPLEEGSQPAGEPAPEGDPNGHLTKQTVTLNVSASGKVYDGTALAAPVVTIEADPSLGDLSDKVSVQWHFCADPAEANESTATPAPYYVGVYSVIVTLPESDTYHGATASVGNIEITKRAITIAAKDQIIDVGEDPISDPSMIEVKGAGLAPGEVINTATITRDGGKLVPYVDEIVNYAHDPAQPINEVDNYAITFENGTVLDHFGDPVVSDDPKDDEADKKDELIEKAPLMKKKPVKLVQTGDDMQAGVVSSALLVAVAGAAAAVAYRKKGVN